MGVSPLPCPARERTGERNPEPILPPKQTLSGPLPFTARCSTQVICQVGKWQQSLHRAQARSRVRCSPIQKHVVESFWVNVRDVTKVFCCEGMPLMIPDRFCKVEAAWRSAYVDAQTNTCWWQTIAMMSGMEINKGSCFASSKLTGRSEVRSCPRCGASVEHVENEVLHDGETTLKWSPVRHLAPCGAQCAGGGVRRSDLEIHGMPIGLLTGRLMAGA
jgi:hypothetical protein